MLGLDQDPALVRIGRIEVLELDPLIAAARRRAGEAPPRVGGRACRGRTGFVGPAGHVPDRTNRRGAGRDPLRTPRRRRGMDSHGIRPKHAAARVNIGGIMFDNNFYDREVDVLYLHVGEPEHRRRLRRNGRGRRDALRAPTEDSSGSRL